MAETHVNLNEASAEELTHIRGVGPEMAKQIVAFRDRHGVIRNWDELKEVPGVTDGLLKVMRRAGFRLDGEGGGGYEEEHEGIVEKLLGRFWKH